MLPALLLLPLPQAFSMSIINPAPHAFQNIFVFIIVRYLFGYLFIRLPVFTTDYVDPMLCVLSLVSAKRKDGNRHILDFHTVNAGTGGQMESLLHDCRPMTTAVLRAHVKQMVTHSQAVKLDFEDDLTLLV